MDLHARAPVTEAPGGVPDLRRRLLLREQAAVELRRGDARDHALAGMDALTACEPHAVGASAREQHALDIGARAQLAAALAHDRGERFHEGGAAALRHRHAAELEGARDDLRHEAAARLLGPQPRVQHPGREQAVRALGCERGGEPVARADERAAREFEQAATAELAVGLAREAEALARPELGREHAEAEIGRAHELLELAPPGGAVAGCMAVELGRVGLRRRGQEGGLPVREERRGGRIRVEVLEAVAAQVVAELRVRGGAREERVPRRHQLVREAGLGQVAARPDRTAEHLVALQHADAPAAPGEHRGARQGIHAGAHEERVELRHGAEHTSPKSHSEPGEPWGLTPPNARPRRGSRPEPGEPGV